MSVEDVWREAVLDHLNRRGIAAKRCELVSKSENFVYRVDTNRDPLAVRLHRPGYHQRAELIAEMHWLNALVAAGCSVPEPVVLDGEAVAQLRVDGEPPRDVTIVRWVDGELLGNVLKASAPDERVALFGEFGRSMARLHVVTDDQHVSQGFERVRWDVDGLLGDNPVWGRFWATPGLSGDDRSVLLAARDKAIAALGRVRSSFGLIHGDMHPFNVVATENGLHIIDFDDCGFGWRAYDVAIALYNFREATSFHRTSGAFLEGYGQVAPPPAAEDIDLFMAIRSLVWLGWVADRPELFSGKRRADALALVVRDAAGYLN